MDRYEGEIQIEGGASFDVDIAEPLNDSGWMSLPIDGVDLQPGMASAGPFRVWLRKAGHALDGWHGTARWAKTGDQWCLAGEGPFWAP